VEIYYQSPSMGLTYILNTSYVTRAVAEERCRCDGGHLVSWESAAEQK
jgi:hypothetical protein